MEHIMKLAITSPLFLPKDIGGTPIATYNIAKYLAKRGHDVSVITAHYRDTPIDERMDGFLVHRVSWPRVRFGVIIFWIKAFLYLLKIKPDIVHVQGSDLSALLLKKFSGTPYVVWGQGQEYTRSPFIIAVIRILMKNADAALALTEHMRMVIQNIYMRRVLVVPNGVDLKLYNNISRDNARKKLNIACSNFILIFVGRFAPVKGLPFLIAAVSMIKNEIPNIKLLLIGYGDEQDNLKESVKKLNLENNIVFLGPIENTEIPAYLSASDVFVLPSLSEGLPLVILEAMAAGLPIIATKITGMPEIIQEGKNGFLVEPANPNDLADRIIYLCNNSLVRKYISENNKAKSEHFGWEKIAEKLEDIYISILKEYIN